MACARKYGITWDYFNTFPFSSERLNNADEKLWDFFLYKCQIGKVQSYSETYKHDVDIINNSDKEIVKKIDEIAEKILLNAKRRNVDEVRIGVIRMMLIAGRPVTGIDEELIQRARRVDV